MKKVLLSIVAVAIGYTVNAQIPTTDLLVHYSFDGTLNDQSVNNYHGSNSSTVSYTTDRHGNSNSAISFGETTTVEPVLHDYTAHPSGFTNQSFSVGFWFKNLGYRVSLSYVLNIGQLTGNFFRLWDGIHGFQYGFQYGMAHSTMSVPNLTSYLDEWNHYMITSEYILASNSRVVKLYINGQLFQEENYGAGYSYMNINSSVQALMIGYNLRAELDDFVYYTRAITPNEVYSVYGECLTPLQLSQITNANNTLTINGLSTASYQWIDCGNSNAEIVGETSHIFEPSVSGSYAVVVSNGTCSDTSDCQSITISTEYTITTSAIPSAGGTITGGGNYNDGATVTLTATPNTGYEFVGWTENGNEVSMVNPYTFTISEDRTIVAEFEAILGIDEINFNSITIYPNPTNSILNIDANENTYIKILNVLGAVVATQNLQTGKNTVDVSTLTNGVYFIQTANGGAVKFIKE